MAHEIAEVVWEDAFAPDVHSTWVDRQTGKYVWKPWLARTVGFVLYDGPEGVVLTDSLGGDDQTGQRQQIPRGMIREFNILGSQPKRKG